MIVEAGTYNVGSDDIKIIYDISYMNGACTYVVRFVNRMLGG